MENALKVLAIMLTSLVIGSLFGWSTVVFTRLEPSMQVLAVSKFGLVNQATNEQTMTEENADQGSMFREIADAGIENLKQAKIDLETKFFRMIKRQQSQRAMAIGELNAYYRKQMIPELEETKRLAQHKLETQHATYLGIDRRQDASVVNYADSTIKKLRQLDAFRNHVEQTEYTTEKTARSLVKGMAEGAQALPSAFTGKGVPAGNGIPAGVDKDQDIAGSPAVAGSYGW